MSAQSMRIKDKLHSVVLLLPWYLTETLSKEDRRDVQTHLADCADCRLELEQGKWLQAMFGTAVGNVDNSLQCRFLPVIHRIREKTSATHHAEVLSLDARRSRWSKHGLSASHQRMTRWWILTLIMVVTVVQSTILLWVIQSGNC